MEHKSPSNKSEQPFQDTRRDLCEECQSINAESLTILSHLSRKLLDLNTKFCPLCNMLSYQRGYLMSNTLQDDLPPIIGDPPSEGDARKHGVVFVMTKEGDPAQEFGMPATHLSLKSTRSEAAFQFLATCLETCAKSHQCCVKRHEGNSTEDIDTGPARVIDVRAFETDSKIINDVRLVETPSYKEYMTLSHCWGGSLHTEHITTKDNFHSRANRIAFHSLPANFRDAIEITRLVGIRYLWIDALCIIQDSPSDWTRESVKMGYIYNCSYLTIAASASKDSFGGCFNNLGTTQASLGGGDLIEVATSLSDGRPSTLIFWKPRLDQNEPVPLKDCPLSERGWAFQERILSPRIIHYTSSQLVWECREVYETEDRLPFVTTRSTRSLSAKETPDRLVDMWYEWFVGPEYASRKFTRMEDRLIAVSGIARSLHQKTGKRYIAGLWADSSLAYGLSWRSSAFVLKRYNSAMWADSGLACGSSWGSSTSQPERRERTLLSILSKRSSSPAPKWRRRALLSIPTSALDRRKPTWTWGSVDFEFEYPQVFLPATEFSFVAASLVFGDIPDDFSHITGGSITVSGKLAEDLGELKFVKMMFDPIPGNNFKFYRYLHLGQYRLLASESSVDIFLILGGFHKNELRFERAGVAEVIDPENPPLNYTGWRGIVQTIVVY